MFDDVVKKYSEALYDVAETEGDDMLEDLRMVGEAYENRELRGALSHPDLGAEEKHAIVENLFRGRVSDFVTNFLLICVDNRRSDLVPYIVKDYEDLYYERRGIERITVVTPIELEEEKLRAIARAYKGDDAVEVRQRIDESLIGGVQIETDTGIIDRSIARQLEDMARVLRHHP
ncbi:F-type ATPase subunit delta [Aedoeadaptatus ivorii]|uniref:ATP synthase subunit delta n=1 Tax=Aedoeadaptatus ivorii TaxID=54006 RepID=A0A448UZV5_9FIRM|nr:ATP synthase F1 subunit delta [Peptoniphilus ivorii]MDQ0508560.1 F-type H+-transporting ATPase subunit delta [Peptoniphilus ivorii]VEJ34434.1 F-type ATPase subunit delta [Peptoniphilus ivorii]